MPENAPGIRERRGEYPVTMTCFVGRRRRLLRGSLQSSVTQQAYVGESYADRGLSSGFHENVLTACNNRWWIFQL